MEKTKRLYAIRGATCVKDTASSIKKNVVDLYEQILAYNSFSESDIVSIQFTMTGDLHALNPATALRKGGYASSTPLFCALEPPVENSLACTIRIMITVYMENPPVHQYCHGAQVLRKDFVSACSEKKKCVWQVTREYAGIAEAGGVKNVARSLAEGLHSEGLAITTFMPLYGCTSFDEISVEKTGLSATIMCAHIPHVITYKKAFCNGIPIIFVDSPCFSEKKAVYTYTAQDENENPLHKRSTGHTDANTLNILLQKAVLVYAQLTQKPPHIIHCQDAHTALLPTLAKTEAYHFLFEKTVFVVSIHNAGDGYRQQIPTLESACLLTDLPPSVLHRGENHAGAVEPFLMAAQSDALLSTVSPWYAKELLTYHDEFSEHLCSVLAKHKRHITGITNGIDFDNYDPTDTQKSLLFAPFNPKTGDLQGKYDARKAFFDTLTHNPSAIEKQGLTIFGSINPTKQSVYFGYQGRIALQKGLDVFAQAARIVLDKTDDTCFVLLGQGDPALEALHIELAHHYEGRYLFLQGYERSLARQCVALNDFLVLPSYFEPCGLEDFIAQIFGTVPIAHAVGGLQKIIPHKTGFLYTGNTKEHLSSALLEAVDFKQKHYKKLTSMIAYAAQYIEKNYSWRSATKEYIKLYKGL
ncbi:MAG: chorismate mutase [Bacteroidales bacterium]